MFTPHTTLHTQRPSDSHPVQCAECLLNEYPGPVGKDAMDEYLAVMNMCDEDLVSQARTKAAAVGGDAGGQSVEADRVGTWTFVGGTLVSPIETRAR